MGTARRKEDRTSQLSLAGKAKPKPSVQMRRVSFNLPEPLFQDIQEFAAERGETMTGVLRWSLGLGKAIWDEVKAGNRVQLVSEDDEVVKELMLRTY